MQLFIEQLLNGLAAGSMYALITLGLALIYGVMKILHVAHASVYTAGAYMGLFIYTSTGSILLAFLGSMIFCAVIGVLIERLIYYPLLKYPPYVPLISSIALLIAIEELCRLVAGPEVRTFSAELPFLIHINTNINHNGILCCAASIQKLCLSNRRNQNLTFSADSRKILCAGMADRYRTVFL